MNLPNRLTLARVVLIPFFVVMLMAPFGLPGQNWIALIIFIAACITDFFDGQIARRRNLITNFGKFMDPLADKLLVCAALVCLSSMQIVPAWMTVVIISREFVVASLLRPVGQEKSKPASKCLRSFLQLQPLRKSARLQTFCCGRPLS